MRLWSIHPGYLDSKGLVALWREALLAKKVLEEKTNGYRNHPQLKRFKDSTAPLEAINYYLQIVHDESVTRGYHFDSSKFQISTLAQKMNVTSGQIEYEAEHLRRKLLIRDRNKLKEIQSVQIFEPHPLFIIVEGNIEDWEILNERRLAKPNR